MSALPRPDVTGPARTLNDALHDLHHRAGWPSLRTLARETGVSHTTVSKVFSSAPLPGWGTLELLVEAMHGDTATFHDLWLAASTPTNGTTPFPPRIAGRSTELDVVRRHLETGTGLLLVTGEAGIGKTTLVSAAVRAAPVFVAGGRCRALTSPVPLLPVSDLLRELLVADHGTWFSAALTDCPAYVGPALGAVLPELESPETAAGSTDFARNRLMSAVSTVLAALNARRPLALVVEDLPWADTATLDTVALLADGRGSVPIVGTWRTEDPETSEEHIAWHTRATRQSREVRLGPLTREETAHQLRLLAERKPSDDELDDIFTRSRGQPLFTEQLATASPGRHGMPDALAQVLAQRLDRLDAEAWAVARALGVADRPLGSADLASAAGLEGDLTSSLHTLLKHRLVVNDEDTVALRHPLFAEAIRNRLVPGESVPVHRRVAGLLAVFPDPPAAEIAGHHEAAGDVDEELTWRLRAGLKADARFALHEAYPEWLRALELWERSSLLERKRPIGLARLHACVIETAIRTGQDFDTLRKHLDRAMAARVPDEGRAEVLMRAGDLECAIGDVDLGLAYLDEAVAIGERHPPTSEAAHILEVRANIHGSLGHHAAMSRDIAQGMAVAAEAGDAPLHRRMLMLSAWQALVDGDPEGARTTAMRARAAVAAEDDPDGCVRVGGLEAEILLATGARAAEVGAATREAVEQAELWGLEGLFPDFLFACVGQAYLREGDVAGAAAVVGPRAVGRTGRALIFTSTVLCAVQVARGDIHGALEHVEAVPDLANYSAGSAFRDRILAAALLWDERATECVARLDRALAFVGTNDLARESAGLLALRARAEADHAAQTCASTALRHRAREHLVAVLHGLPVDPFGPAGIGADRRAHALSWQAELGRLGGTDTTDAWLGAASAWDGLHRRHDAAYARWRAAQCALREGQGTVAAKLLKRAAVDAREHVPLSRAIAGTAGR